MFPLAERMKLVSESITLAVSAKANALKKAGVDVVGFGAGEPDFDTPAFIKDAAKAALDKGQTKYTPTPCMPELQAGDRGEVQPRERPALQARADHHRRRRQALPLHGVHGGAQPRR